MLTCRQVARLGNQRYKLRISGRRKRIPFEEDLVFVRLPTVDFSSGMKHSRRTTSYPRVLWSSLSTTNMPKGWAGRRGIQHSWFREVPRQISSPFVLPFARCQPMNSVCLGRRAHRHTGTRVDRALSEACISIGIRSSFFPEGVLGLMSGRAAGKGRKNEEHAEEQSNSGQCSRRQTPDGTLPGSACLDLSRGLLLTFNGPILCRPILSARRSALEINRRLSRSGKNCSDTARWIHSRGEDLIEATWRDFFFFFFFFF